MANNTVFVESSPGRRAAEYWFVDGLPELVFGAAYLLWGSLAIFWKLSLPNPWMKAAVLVCWLAFIVLFWKDRAILSFIKSRVTYPRTGYVRPPAADVGARHDDLITLATPVDRVPDENVTSFGTRGAFVFFVGMQLLALLNTPWMLPVIMTAVAAMLWLGRRDDVHPYSLRSVALLPVAGLIALFLDVPTAARQFVPLIIGGLWLTALGGSTLLRYLRSAPAPSLSELARS